MVGRIVPRECRLDPAVEAVLAIGRGASGVSHPRLRDLVRADMFDFDVNAEELTGYDACCFCLGLSSAGSSEAASTRVTHHLTIGWGRTLGRSTPRSDSVTCPAWVPAASRRGRG